MSWVFIKKNGLIGPLRSWRFHIFLPIYLLKPHFLIFHSTYNDEGKNFTSLREPDKFLKAREVCESRIHLSCGTRSREVVLRCLSSLNWGGSRLQKQQTELVLQMTEVLSFCLLPSKSIKPPFFFTELPISLHLITGWMDKENLILTVPHDYLVFYHNLWYLHFCERIIVFFKFVATIFLENIIQIQFNLCMSKYGLHTIIPNKISCKYVSLLTA